MSSTSTSHISLADVGVTLRANVNFPLHDAEAVSFIVNTPTGNKELVATIVDADKGIISYKTKQGDLTIAGPHRIQARIIMKTGGTYHGSTHSFKVVGLYE